MKGYKQGTRKKEFTCEYCKKKFITFISKKPRFCGRYCFKKSGIFQHNKSHTEEANEKNRQSHLGKKMPTMVGHPDWSKGKGWFKKGSKPWNYQGGVRTKSQIIKDDVRYKKWRDKVFIRDKYTCQECGKKGCYIEAHHIKSKVRYSELAFKVSNGQTLCLACHKLTDSYAGRANKKT